LRALARTCSEKPPEKNPMEPFTWLFFLCVAMFVGAFGSGYIPLSFSMSEARLRMVTIFGAGLLVGTALIVIIPEGVAMHYEGQQRHHAAAVAAAAAAAGGSVEALPSALSAASSLAANPSTGPVVIGGSLEGSAAAAAAAGVAAGHVHAEGEEGHSHAHGEGEREEEEITHAHPGHWQIGAALAVGFAFQLVVDRISGGLHSHSHGIAVPGGSSASAPTDTELNVRANTGGDHSAKSKSALMGMVVHAFVDGVALGAAVREGDSALGLIVFLAIMLHKAPSSFGLSSYLLHHGISHDGGEKGGREREGKGPRNLFCRPSPRRSRPLPSPHHKRALAPSHLYLSLP
jgi:zinc transporter 9